MISRLVTLPVKLSQRQYAHLKEVKEVHGRSMASQIRTLVQQQIYGIGQIAASQISKGVESGPKRTRPVQLGPSGYSTCVMELNAVFEARRKIR